MCGTACTDPAPAGPITGTFALNAQFVGRVQQTIPCTSSGCVIKYDTTAVNGGAVGKIFFDTTGKPAFSPTVSLSLGPCDFCLVNAGSVGSALQDGDSVKLSFGAIDRFLRLRGVYRGDSVAGRIESVESGTTNNTYWGTFVLTRADRDPRELFTLRGLFDSVTTTDGQGHIATRAAVSDSIRGPLTVDDITTAPIGQLTVEKCGPECFGQSGAFPAAYNGFTGAGVRRGDSVSFAMLWDLMSSIRLRGEYRGDSIVGSMTSYRGTSTSTTYTGTFVARRNP